MKVANGPKKTFERLINNTITTIFCVSEKEAHRFMFERCITLMSDPDNGLRRGMSGTEHPGPLESKTKAKEEYRLLRYLVVSLGASSGTKLSNLI